MRRVSDPNSSYPNVASASTRRLQRTPVPGSGRCAQGSASARPAPRSSASACGKRCSRTARPIADQRRVLDDARPRRPPARGRRRTRPGAAACARSAPVSKKRAAIDAAAPSPNSGSTCGPMRGDEVERRGRMRRADAAQQAAGDGGRRLAGDRQRERAIGLRGVARACPAARRTRPSRAADAAACASACSASQVAASARDRDDAPARPRARRPAGSRGRPRSAGSGARPRPRRPASSKRPSASIRSARSVATRRRLAGRGLPADAREDRLPAGRARTRGTRAASPGRRAGRRGRASWSISRPTTSGSAFAGTWRIRLQQRAHRQLAGVGQRLRVGQQAQLVVDAQLREARRRARRGRHRNSARAGSWTAPR